MSPGGTPAVVCKAAQRENVKPGPRASAYIAGMGGEPETIPSSPAGTPTNGATDSDPVAAALPAAPAGEPLAPDDPLVLPAFLKVGTPENNTIRGRG
jgi:hypothetical protein